MTDRDMPPSVEWVDLYGDFLFRFALSRTRNVQLAEDLVQETLLAALKSQSNFAGKASIRTWLVTILKHKMVDYFRKTYREKPLDTDHEIPPDPLLDSFDSKGRWSIGPQAWQIDPTKVAERKQFWKVLQHCLDTLPERLAHIFTLRELDDLSTEELCKVFHITPTNLWVILHRARNRLRRCFEVRWLQT